MPEPRPVPGSNTSMAGFACKQSGNAFAKEPEKTPAKYEQDICRDEFKDYGLRRRGAKMNQSRAVLLTF
jgi:hypothetical protein